MAGNATPAIKEEGMKKLTKGQAWFVAGVVWIALWTAIGYESIGEFSATCNELYPWYMPLLMGGVNAIPFFCGLLASDND